MPKAVERIAFPSFLTRMHWRSVSNVTVMLKPWANPSVSDTYMFQVQAFPAGHNPSPASLGFATLRIYDPDWR